jgi:UDP-N-acetylmuramate--alanine ligase
VVLLPIYPARELPVEGVTSALILNNMKLNDKAVMSKDELLSFIQKNKRELIVMAGAGDIDNLVQPIKQILEN